MIEQSLQSVLFIDDRVDIYLSSLKPAAEAAGYELYSADHVLEGLNFIKTYNDRISAVILDLNFPRGEIQGLEAIQKIKILQPDLPVIMLTDSDSAADIDRVVECMRKGAYNYIGKRTLNPVYLFQVVEKAVGEAKLHERFRVRNTIPDKTHQFFTLKADYEFGRFTKSGIFGFELISVNKPGNEQEAANLEKIALQWHENLLKSLSVIYCNEIQVNLKYIAENNKINCYIIFTVLGIDDKSLEQTLQSLQFDIKVFFSPQIRGDIHPYLFDEISDVDFLLNANLHSNDFKYNTFYREPLRVKAKKSIGFDNSTPEEPEAEFVYNPDELFPLPTQLQFDSELLFKSLINQKEYVEIDILVIPKQLLTADINLIKRVINDTWLIDSENLTAEERILFSSYLKKFIVNSKDKFLINVILKRKTTKWLHGLKMSVLNNFFGYKEDVGYQLREPDKLVRYSTSKEFNSNRLPFFYNSENAIQIFHLPIPGLYELPGINQQSHYYHFLPENLSEDGIQLGVKKTSESEKIIRIDNDSLARHLYVMGQTGTGKSTMLKTMISDCIDMNYGFTVIDPHGDLFDNILKLIPKSRKNKVFIIDTTDPENSMKFNPLLYDENMPQAKSLVVNEILSALDSIYDLKITGGPVFELYFKNALFLLLDEVVVEKFGKAALANMLNVFLDDEFRRERLLVCGNKNVCQFFKNAVVTTGEASFGNIANYITSKLTRFVEDFYLSPILNSDSNNIDFRKLIDDSSIFLVKMDKGLIGSINTSLLGQLILSKIILAGMSRSNVNIDERKPHYIFIDEFQNFVKGDVGSALSEVRKYGLNLILANQTLGQLNDYLIQSLLGNVGSLVFFRPGIYDYEKLKYYIEPDFKREDVLKLPNFNCISRLMINNVPSDPFVFQTKI